MDPPKSSSPLTPTEPASVDDYGGDKAQTATGASKLATLAGESSPASRTQVDQPIDTAPNAWSKPLSFSQPSTATTVLMRTTNDLIADLSRETQWPSLSAATNATSKRGRPFPRVRNESQSLPTVNNSVVGTFSSPQSSPEYDSEYPWASKMDKSKRNLHKVTSPEFLVDGTPKVRIPRKVLLEGLENQREFVFGQFYRCSAPAPGQIQSVVSRIWGTRCRIYTRQLGNNAFLFHIPDEPTRKWVTQRGIWHVDDCLMFVSNWDPKGTISLPEISTIPVWLTLKDIPLQLYSRKGISWIASGIGAPMLTSKPWLDPILMGEAKILVEVKLDRPFPQRVALEDESGSISMVTVIYSWLPSVCPKCGQLGHKANRCLGLPPIPNKSSKTMAQTKANVVTDPKEGLGNISIDDQGCILLHEESDIAASVEDSVLSPTINGNSEIGERLDDPVTVPFVSEATANTTIDSLEDHQATNVSDVITHVTQVSDEDNLPASAPLTITTNEGTQTSSPTKESSNVNHFDPPAIALVQNQEEEPTLDVCEKVDCTKSLVSPIVFSTPTLEEPLGNIANLVDDSPTTKSAEPLALVNLFSVLDSVAEEDPPSTEQVSFEPPPPSSAFVFKQLRDPPEANEDSAQRSRGGRPLKPSQKLKETEWFTIVGRGRRGRGRGSLH